MDIVAGGLGSRAVVQKLFGQSGESILGLLACAIARENILGGGLRLCDLLGGRAVLGLDQNVADILREDVVLLP